jgi:hypothetical protein
LDECSVYSFNPEIDSDPNAEDGALYVIWYFFLRIYKEITYNFLEYFFR